MKKEKDSEFVWGAKNIGGKIKRGERQTRWMIKTGQLPVHKSGDRYFAKLDELIDPTTWPKARKASAA